MQELKSTNEIPIPNLLAIVFSYNKWKIPKNSIMNLVYKYSMSLIDSGYRLNIKFKRFPSIGWWSSDIHDEIQYWIQNEILLDNKGSFIIDTKKNRNYIKEIISSFPKNDQIILLYGGKVGRMTDNT